MAWWYAKEINRQWMILDGFDSYHMVDEVTAKSIAAKLNENESCPICDGDEVVFIDYERTDGVPDMDKPIEEPCPTCQEMSPEEAGRIYQLLEERANA